ncbi:epidermal growth factor receptor substrate 15 isoform X7 [Esox lucius]|uniref:epidermal growth factor receptor substrate 15 isoform X7 n=1 Tax=Esox lucius TaxID=8010 RepID=UPI001476FAFE|nr:epidermal growth factor receptor substrate 15 isoform X7 [Esox lucius]
MMRFLLDCLRTPRQRAPCSVRNQDFVEHDDCVIQKTGEIRILSLQAEEAAREMKVEEYERELARARRKLKQLKIEVRQAQGKVEAAGECIIPLEDSISQSYEEILQEECMLSILRGEQTRDATLPDHQQVEPNDTSPCSLRTEDGTVDIPDVPAWSWGRSQSLPVYAEILANLGCAARAKNGLTDTQEEEEETLSTPKQIDKGEEKVKVEEKITKYSNSSIAIKDLDFYHPDPFIHCESEHDLFKDDDLFTKTDKSDDDPFKGTNPFGADVLFSEGTEEPYCSNDSFPGIPACRELGSNDETDKSLSCADNKASTGTQCFESEFPDEDETSDIEISYSREDLDAVHSEAVQLSFVEPKTLLITECLSFKPIYTAQTCSLDIELEDEAGSNVASGRESFSQASRATPGCWTQLLH